MTDKLARVTATQVQSPLYWALDQGYITQEGFEEIYDQANNTAI